MFMMQHKFSVVTSCSVKSNQEAKLWPIVPRKVSDVEEPEVNVNHWMFVKGSNKCSVHA